MLRLYKQFQKLETLNNGSATVVAATFLPAKTTVEDSFSTTISNAVVGRNSTFLPPENKTASSDYNTQSDQDQCWETYVGQVHHFLKNGFCFAFREAPHALPPPCYTTAPKFRISVLMWERKARSGKEGKTLLLYDPLCKAMKVVLFALEKVR